MYLDARACFDESALYWLATSTGVKVTQQGFFYYNTPVLHSTETFACTRTLGALCNHTATNTIFMPCTTQPLIPVSDIVSPFDRFWRWESKCGKSTTLSSEYHVTLCDLQRGTALLWSDGMLSVQYEMELPYWPNMIMLFIVIWLVINLGESIALILEVDGSSSQNHSTALLCIALIVTVTVCTPEGTWVTQEERTLYWFVLVYIVLYSLYHIKNTNTVNVIVGCLILVSSRMYQTHETPYVASLLFLVAARFVQKLIFCEWGKFLSSSFEENWFMWVRLLFMVLDVVLFTLCYLFAFQPSIRDPIQAQLYIVGLLFPAVCMGGMVGAFAKSRSAKLAEKKIKEAASIASESHPRTG